MLKKVEDILAKTEGIESYQTVGGYGVVTNTYQPNYGSLFARLKPWEERHGEELHVKGIMAKLQREFATIPEGVIFAFNIPTLSGFGAASGFNFLIQDRTGTMTVDELGDQARRFIAAGRQRPELGNLFTSFDPNYPQVKVDLDREKARTLGVPVNEVFQTMSTAMGGAFVNDFNRFGRLYRVYVQAESIDRLKDSDIGRIYVRSRTTNSMIPLSTLVSVKDHRRNGTHNALQLVALSGTSGRTGARLYLGSGARCTRGSLCSNDAEGNEFCLLITFVSGEDRATTCTNTYSGHHLRLPVAGGDV